MGVDSTGVVYKPIISRSSNARWRVVVGGHIVSFRQGGPTIAIITNTTTATAAAVVVVAAATSNHVTAAVTTATAVAVNASPGP